jgi:hypothetical protein
MIWTLPIKWIAARVQIGTSKGAKSVLDRWAQAQHQTPSVTEPYVQLELRSNGFTPLQSNSRLAILEVVKRRVKMRKLRNRVSFSVDSLEDFEQRSFAERVIRSILAGPRFCTPTKYGRNQPLRREIDPSDISELLDLWTSVANSKNSRAAYPEGLLLMEFAKDEGYLVYWRKFREPSFPGISGGLSWPVLKGEPRRFEQFLSLVKELAVLTNAVYGEFHNALFPGWDTPRDLEKRLPDVPWLSIYGRPYIEMFGERAIESAPFHRIERLRSGHYVLQATESIEHPVPEAVRASIRKHLDEDAFMSGGRWRYKSGKSPEFDFSNVLLK